MSLLPWIRASLVLALLGFTDFGDWLESRPVVVKCKALHAVLDTLIHCWIGLLTWGIVSFDSGRSGLWKEFLVVAIGSSLIDIDHFISARSFKLSDAVHAGHRGIFHCTGLALLGACLLIGTGKPQWALLLLIVAIPHHLRDAQRRGLYMIPFKHDLDLPPIHKHIVRILLPVLACTFLYFRRALDPSSVKYSSLSTSIV